MNIEELEQIIRDRICRVCTERTVSGQCGREDPASCALFRLMPQVAKAVEATRSDDIRDYIASIRKHVCSVCSQEMSDGSCEERAAVQCSLDAYLMLVVDAIEEATGREFDRSVLAQPAPATVRLTM